MIAQHHWWLISPALTLRQWAVFYYPTDFDGNAISGDIKVTLSTGDVVTFASSSALPFVGFSASPGDGFITSLSFNNNGAANDSNWPALDHFYVGTQVPIPPSAMLLGSGLLGLVGLGWRRRKES